MVRHDVRADLVAAHLPRWLWSAVVRVIAAPTSGSARGEFENQSQAMARLRLVVPISIALSTVLLFLSLRSWSLAGLVLVNLPFAAMGEVFALWFRGLHLSV